MSTSKRPPKTTRPKTGDALATETTILAKVDESGLNLKAKSRTVAAVDRLFGGVFGIPGEYVEGIRARMEAKTEVAVAQIRAGGAAQKDAQQTIEQRLLAIEYSMAEDQRKFENKWAVWQEAQEFLLAAPLAEATGEDAPPPAEEAPSEINDDWMNVFADYAGRASSASLRSTWGKILAGEIGKPGEFSIRTLRVVSELDSGVAAKFAEIAKRQVQGAAIVNLRDGNVDRSLSELQEAGLILGADGTLGRHAGPPNTEMRMVRGANHALVVKCPVSANLSYSVVSLTKAGTELASILEHDEVFGLTEISKHFVAATQVEIYKLAALETDPNRMEFLLRLK